MLVALLASGEIEKASGVFSRMPMREILSWNAMIAAYGRIDAGAAKNIFDQALERDIIAWNTLLRVCARFGLLDSAREAMEKMPLWDPVSCTTILAAHTQRGVLADAKKIFDAVPRNLFSWNAMLACYLQNREVGTAMGILAEMPEKDVITWNTMIAGLAANGHLADAKAIFESMASRDATSWGSIVAALAEDESSIEEALGAYRRMPQHDLCSWNALIAKDIAAARGIFDGAKERNVVTWTSLIVATCRVADGIGGAEDILERMPAWDVVCLNVMIGAHSQCGNFERAKEIFDGLPERSLHSWNAMLQIATAMEEEQGDCYCEGTREIFFDRMPARDVVSWTILLAAFAQQSLLAEAKRAFDLAPQRSLITWNVMLGIYASASAIDPAKEIFQSMPERDIVSQNSIVAAFALGGQIDESLQFLERMPQHNAGSWNSLLLGCAHHGVLDRSKQFFARVPNKNIVSWNALLDACARNGQGELAIEMLRELCLDGSSLPDGISFTHVLAACTHIGSLEISRSFFVSLAHDYGLIADKEHCCSMVDVLCRSGQLGFAEELINSVPLLGSDNVALGSLLAACHTHHDLERAYRALPRDHTSSSHYVILSNILTSI
ncbi:pentatricopeptide repeat-containing protein At4g02750-like [Selaginella moellendorffii]|uniref:pentatricopeptide repeat-containing protein At4g02750-like n=1 Tax=Selaginella moellendorffii TaxID=88036 RepID=UPI000D1CC313|nr:pentatricopeptide repeat-containing protein At4g02750-like [Selaginella moellendorffii]|eukprot:XP_024523467.1 pentatricopeptide repeat-containing protein At4g02750-like [Selaginella moellendorffii]